MASGILLPRSRIEWAFAALQGRFLTTGPSEKSLFPFLDLILNVILEALDITLYSLIIDMKNIIVYLKI